ncbi:MAG: glycine zipper 2TM domain-containing protein [Pseudomonadota bacterium]
MRSLSFIALTAALAGTVQAQDFTDQARVRRVEPHYETVSVPRQQCTSQWVTEPRQVASNRNYGGLAVGGLAGAVLGSQVGKGNGRTAAAAVGAVVGALAGEHFANQQRWGTGGQMAHQDVDQREVRNCHTVQETRQRLAGYQVDYEYQGQVYSTRTREHPGRTLPVRVSVAPLESSYPQGAPVAAVLNEREYHRPRDY